MPENTVEIEGIICEVLSVAKTGIKPGDLYVARRNGPWKLFTCRAYHPYDPETCADHHDFMCGLVIPVEPGYPFNDYECFKVAE